MISQWRPELTGMQLALPIAGRPLKGGLRLPPCVPPFNTLAYRIFTLLWMIAFALALVGPIAGLYLRYVSPANNSQLLLGSRAGFAVSPRDATIVRFTVGPRASDAGIVPGDHITAIYGLPLPPSMPVNEEALAEHANDPAYIALGNLLFGTDSADVPLTIRGPDGHVRDVTVTTGDFHIDAGARALGISPKMAEFHRSSPRPRLPVPVVGGGLLHHRNSRDAVSSILLACGAADDRAPNNRRRRSCARSASPRWLNVALFDLGNVLLLTGILLFPHGNLSWRRVGLIASLPIIMFLHGTLYQSSSSAS